MRTWVLVCLIFSSFLIASEGVVSASPDNDLALTVKTIRSAKKKLSINIYELTSVEVSKAIISAIRSGVSVDLLQEGQPVGGISSAGRDIQESILAAMEESGGIHQYYEMKGEKKARRFAYDHAKYIVVDNEKLLIGSENYSPAGQPKVGTKGNRGWEILLNDSNLVHQYARLFHSDTNLDNQDISSLLSNRALNLPVVALAGPGWIRLPNAAINSPQKLTAEEITVEGTTLVTSPDTSLIGIRKFIQNAARTLEIEQMNLALEWSGALSPPVQEIIQAARRGVKVRVLLNDEKAFGPSAKDKNRETIDYINEIGTKEGLKLEGRIANLKRMGVKIIHNKGALSDGKNTLISSINWNQNSIQNNREAAVVVNSLGVNRYYSQLFEKDWKDSE